MGTLTARKGLEEGRHAPPLPLRALGWVLLAAGACLVAWVVLVWRWQDPFSAVYTRFEQRRLSASYASLASHYRPPSAALDVDAAQFRRSLRIGAPVGRLHIPRIGLDMVVVQGTDESTLRKGPGHYVASALPGEGGLIYVAGHRTTYLAPFSRIDRIRVGDTITFELPYGTYRYRVDRHYVVAAGDVAVLRATGREILRLQACHPRFFATERYIVDARLVAAGLARPPRRNVRARASTGSAG